MLILLPPSETKTIGGDPGTSLDLEQLSFPKLSRTRERTLRTLIRVSGTKNAAKTLGLGPTQARELTDNLSLLEAPTLPAIERYTGVLFDALDIASIRGEERERACERLLIGSALFGLLRASDPIPTYRLSAGTTLPRIGSLTGLWRPVLGPVLEKLASKPEPGPWPAVVDLRSGAYQNLAPAPSAITVRVLTERPDGTRSVVSHFNKATKGQLARVLATTPKTCTSIEDVAHVASQGGFEVEQRGPRELDILTR